ncbi:hypothetical protein BDV26DRAFT_256047 [Aspergillus bertholletiae]|uniref:Uncharacterized protein n=1 Tax=Aspergillus bertholletiae TaxID=1226010 RepID=A0A5N7BH33_9EURO|nr:hypothetical protein BDV26DRAFT_256047 [Aspergillus bertholletiae]
MVLLSVLSPYDTASSKVYFFILLIFQVWAALHALIYLFFRHFSLSHHPYHWYVVIAHQIALDCPRYPCIYKLAHLASHILSSVVMLQKFLGYTTQSTHCHADSSSR